MSTVSYIFVGSTNFFSFSLSQKSSPPLLFRNFSIFSLSFKSFSLRFPLLSRTTGSPSLSPLRRTPTASLFSESERSGPAIVRLESRFQGFRERERRQIGVVLWFMAGLISLRANLNLTCRVPSRQAFHTLHVFSPCNIKYPIPSFTGIGPLKKPLLLVPAALDVSSTSMDTSLPSGDVLNVWQSSDAVCFDVDSTVCLDEGIDELADFCGAGQAVAEWTTRAMNGAIPFEEALAARLSLFKPSLSQVQDFLEKRPPRISPGIAVLITKLKENGTDVYLVSGGFRQMIEPVASTLGIPFENIFANNLLFGDSGEFLGFDASEPTSRSGGKALAVQQIREAHHYKTLVMIGDGATDLEARKPGGADLFICYAGVQMREAVAREADWIVFNFKELVNNLP